MSEEWVELSHTSKHNIVGISVCDTILDAYELTKGIPRKDQREVEKEICGRRVTIEVENWDARSGKLRRYARVPRDLVKAVVQLSPTVELIEGEGEIKTEEVVETKKEDNKLFRDKFLYYYYVEPNGNKRLLKKQFVEREVEYVGKPKVIVTAKDTVNGVKLIIEGDTYPIRSLLKKYKFKWDSISRYWYRYVRNEEDRKQIHEFAQKLKEVAEVVVKRQ